MANHLVISWIQVGGLAASLYGSFYVSMGLIPQSASVLRPLLVTAAILVTALLLISILSHTVNTGSGPSLRATYSILVFPLGLVCFNLANSAQQRTRSPQEPLQGYTRFFMYPAFGIVVVPLAVVNQVSLFDALIEGIAWMCISAIFMEATIAIRSITQSRRSLIGTVLIASGLLSLFVPAVLEVGGATIR